MSKVNVSSSGSQEATANFTAPGSTKHKRPAGRRSRKWRLRATLVATSSVLALLIGEVGLRLAVEQEGKRWASYDKVLGWRGTPHASGRYIRKADNIHVAFRYNNLGFRDQDVQPKPIGGKRLMLLGDSFVESLEVDLEQTFGAVLESSLQHSSGSWDVCVIGSQGYSTAQELLAFRQYQPVVKADLVLLCFYCGNDFADNLRQRFAYLDQQQQLILPVHHESNWIHWARHGQRWLYESSHVVYLLKNSLESYFNLPLVPASKTVVEQDETYQRDITHGLLQQLHQDVTASGAKLGVVIIPDREDLLKSDRRKIDFVIDCCQSSGIACLDLAQTLTARDFFGTDLHFNPRGHRVVAQAIEGFVATGMEMSKQVAQAASTPIPLLSGN